MPNKPKELGDRIERHAFVVDDQPQVCAFISKCLVDLGFNAHSFGKIAEVESALTEIKPDIIVLDLSLKESDAIEVMKSLAKSLFSGKILLISGHDQSILDDVQSVGEGLGFALMPSLRKPFRIEELRTRVATATQSPDDQTKGVDLENALKNKWLELWYQPKIDLNSFLVCSAEALVRVRHPERGVLLPAVFLPPAGDPLYEPLTDFVVRRSLSDWSSFAERKIITPIAINVPASILQSREFVENLRRHFPTHEKFPGLNVEITEDEAIRDPELAKQIAVQLKLYNIRVSIDDFGTGYSSFSRLDQLPFDELKLDRKFVNGCSTDERKREICKKVALLARHSNMATVAEGVETEEDLKVLMDLGYDMAQGYFFSKPLPKSQFIELILSRTTKKSRALNNQSA